MRTYFANLLHRFAQFSSIWPIDQNQLLVSEPVPLCSQERALVKKPPVYYLQGVEMVKDQLIGADKSGSIVY